jgi:tetratricopeptide (TPR) repeat protein
MNRSCLTQTSMTRAVCSRRLFSLLQHRALLRVGLLSLIAIVCAQSAFGQRRTQRTSSAPVKQQATETQNVPQGDFDQLAAQANAARDGDRLDEAIADYRKALAIRPQWTEGWWYLATILYDQDKYADAAHAFREAAKQQPKAGAVWGMLGLCEFQLLRYDDALLHIQQARQLGVGDNVELTRVLRYHEGVLSILKGEFEQAQQLLGALSYEGVKSEDLITALGLAVLRIGMTPKEVDINYRDHDLVRRAGLAEHFAAQKNISDAQREYDMLARDYAKVPNVQYAYGRFLFNNRDEDGALAAFQRELQNWPKHVLARCQIAYIKLQRKEIDSALPFAEEAVKQAPRLPLAHYLLGRLLLEAGQTPRAIQELETAAQMVPNEAKIYFALARAYSKVHRKEDADRARETFTKLSQQNQVAGQAGASGSALPDDAPATEKPPQP